MTRTLRTLAGALLLAALAACGGGGTGSTGSSANGPSGNQPTVSTLQASNAAYSRTMTVSVSGVGLDGALEMSSDNVCTNITRLASTSELSQTFTCRVGSIGEYNLSINTTAGARLASLRVNVPQPQVTLNTGKGAIVVELDLLKAPLTVDNFLAYVNDSPGFYRNVIFHRVLKDDVIQAGGFGFDRTTNVAPVVARTQVRPPIVLESNNGLKHLRGTLGMARDPAGADTATSQFFINLKDNPQNDYQSADAPGLVVFGRIVSGQDVADSIGAVDTRYDLAFGLASRPLVDIFITSAVQSK